MNVQRPSRPPPPSIPEGWLAVWDEEYQCYFYVNKYTNESTWDIPTHVPPQHPPREVPPPVVSSGKRSTGQQIPVSQQPQVVHVQTVPVMQQVPVQTVPVQQVPVQQVPTQKVSTGPSAGSMAAAGAGLFALGSIAGRRRRPVAVVPVAVRPGARRRRF